MKVKHKMPGRPARVKYETIFNVLKDMPIFHENGMLKKQRDPVWAEASKILREMNTHNLYLFVHQDRKNIKTNLMNHLNIECTIPMKPKKIKKREPVSKYSDIWDDYDYYETLDTNDEQQDVVTNDFETLILMKSNDEYKKSLHRIAAFPFSVDYWHKPQITLWQDLINIESTVSLIVLDQVVSNLKGNVESTNIYLYALAVKLENTTLLLAQMLSSSVQNLEVLYFFNNWLQSSAPAPQELVVGYSYSLLDAASLAFNFSTFDKYNLRCYQYLMNEVSDLPPTLIYVDTVTLIKVVDGWSCFENILQPVKDLYLCSIMYLSTVDNLDEFREAVISILTLCQSPFQTEELESRKTALWAHLVTDTIMKMNQEYIQFVTEKNGPKNFSYLNIKQKPTTVDSSHAIYDYINQLNLQAFEMCDFTTDQEKAANDYYCPIVLENLIQLLIEFPSWTKIIFKKNECSTLVSLCSSKHWCVLHDLKGPMNVPQFLTYHLDKLEILTQQGKLIISKAINRNEFIKAERTNHHAHLIPLTYTEENTFDNRIEINLPTEDNLDDEMNENNELDLSEFKTSVYSTIHSLLEFDEYIHKIMKTKIKRGQESIICKVLLDCCAEMKTYEKFIGIVSGRFCLSNQAFANSFRQIFVDCYNAVELIDKNELKNTSKLLAHLLTLDSVSWDILYIFKLNEKEMTSAKKNFIRVLLQELAEHMGFSKLQEKFQNKAYKQACKGLFPTDNPKDALFAANFYKSIGLKGLGDMVKNNSMGKETSTLKRSSSNSSISSNSSCDYIIELRVSKKSVKNKNPSEERRKVIVI